MKNTDVFYNSNPGVFTLSTQQRRKCAASVSIALAISSFAALLIPQFAAAQSLVNPYLPETEYQTRIARKFDVIQFDELPPLLDSNQSARSLDAASPKTQQKPTAELIENPFVEPKPTAGPTISKISDRVREKLRTQSPNFLAERRQFKKHSGLIFPISKSTLNKIDPIVTASTKQLPNTTDHANTTEVGKTVHGDWKVQLENPYAADQQIDYSLPDSPQYDVTLSYRELSENRLFNQQHTFSLTLDEAMHLAVANSPELRALNADVIINNNEIVRQDAAFDFSHFVETLYDSQVNPVGNNLDGAQNTLRNKLWNLETGVRKQNRYGGEMSLSQQFGHLNSNSIFINPNNQATGQLAFELNQPLSRGSDRDINEAGIELARIATLTSQASLRTEIQNQLLLIVDAYWNLVLQRGKVVQLNRSVARGNSILQMMIDRQRVDVLPQQIIRTKAAVARRQAAATQAAFDALRAQESLMRRVFGEQYQAKATFEIVPLTIQPGNTAISDLQSGLAFGIQNRPEVHAAMQEIHSAGIQKRLADNDLNPQLDLVFAAFGKGLRGDSNFGQAWGDQFTANEPSVQIGINYEFPLGNRAARANASQKELAIAKLQSQLQTVLNDVALEIRDQDIVREQYGQTVSTQMRSLELAYQELETIQTRRKLLLDGDQIALLYLDDLIQAQERVQQAETEYLSTITNFGISQARWLKAIGALDQYDVGVQ